MAKKRFKVRRQARYEKLSSAYFLPEEAASMSAVHTVNYVEIKQMMKVRRGLFLSFRQMAYRRGWSPNRSRYEWREFIKRWYKQHGYLKHKTTKTRKNEPWWNWFQAISDKLPPEKRYTLLRHLRRRTRRLKAAITIGEKVNISKWINQLTRAITRENDLETKQQYKLQRERLRRVLRGSHSV